MSDKKPLLDAQIRTEFGDVLAETLETGRSKDLTEVPGFHEMKVARDVEIATAFQEGRKAKLQPLPVNLRWVRVTRPAGGEDAVKAVGAKLKGYTAVTRDQVGQHNWITDLPAGASVMADGTIRLGDQMLMVVPAETAARNEATKLKNMLELNNHEFANSDLAKAGGEATKIDGYTKAEIFKK